MSYQNIDIVVKKISILIFANVAIPSHHLENYAKLLEVDQLTAKITLINGNILPSNPHVVLLSDILL